MTLSNTSFKRSFFKVLFFIISILFSNQSFGLNGGTYAVGPGQTYTNLAAVAAALNGQSITGNVIFELQSNYTDASIASTVSFTGWTGSSSFTVTIRPASGVSSTLITAGTPAANTPLISLAGTTVKNLIFDGRPGGTGSTSKWTIQNTSATATCGPVFNMLTDASFNTLQYLDIQGGANSATANMLGNITLGTASTTGNDNNTINNCLIHEYSTSFYPKYAIYELGTSAATAPDNITITNNQIYNFTVGGIYCTTGVTGPGNNWDIEFNHFYNTTNVVPSSNFYVIFFGPTTTSSGGKISNNFIGGHTTNCGGAIWSVSTSFSVFNMIFINSALADIQINNNTIQNIRQTSSSVAVPINGITISSTGLYTVSGNTIGHNTTAANGIINDGQSNIVGINNSGAGTLTITGNTVANLQTTFAGANSYVYGIYSTSSASATNTFSGNIVHDLTGNNTTTSDVCEAGIYAASATGSSIQNISGNTIYNISNTNTTSNAYTIAGIKYNGASAVTTNMVQKNLIYNISLATTNTAGEISGIKAAATFTTTVYTLQNNMIMLGYNASGAITTGYAFMGINIPVNVLSHYYHNTVVIGGTGVASVSNTYAFYTTSTSTTARNIQNNVFWNARSNSSGSAKNYAIRVQNVTGQTSNYNVLYANGTGNVLGNVNGTTDYAALSNWQGVAGEANSISVNPNLADPTNFTTPNLHILGYPEEGNGLAVTGIYDDLDGDSRAFYTPADIGADAGNYTSIVYTPINTRCNTYTSVTGVVIKDAAGINTTSGTRPRLYYKKSTDGNVLNSNSSGTDGWKYVEANGTTSPFDFTLNYSLLNSGSASSGDVIQYFIVAQDVATTPNVHLTPGLTFAALPSSVSLTSAAFPIAAVTGSLKSFTLNSPSLSGTVYIGTGAGSPQYSNLSALFAAINTNGLSGNLTAIVQQTTITEPSSPTALTAVSSCGAYTITIQPASATVYTITSPASPGSSTSLVTFNGASNVIIDGNFSGSGQYLKFINLTSSSANSTFLFQNSANNITIKNCLISVSCTAFGATCINLSTSASGTTGNSYLTFNGNNIGDASQWTTNEISSTGSAGIPNHDITISNNNIFSFSNTAGSSATGINVTSTGNGSNWTITGNSFYNSSTSATGQGAINFVPGSNSISNTISNNYIGGSAALATGTWNTSGAFEVDGIVVNAGADPNNPTVVSGNTITNISAASGAVVGILISVNGSSAVNITNNTIGSGTTATVLVGSNASGYAYGIDCESSGIVNITGNTIGGLFSNGATSKVYGIYQSTSVANIQNNTIINIYHAATANNCHARGIYATPSGTGNIISGNTVRRVGSSTSTGSYSTTTPNETDGIVVSLGAGNTGTIANNKCTEFFHTTLNGGWSFGIYIQGAGSWNVYNNMVNMYNKSFAGTGTVYTTRKKMHGIFDNTTGGTNNYYFNTVLLQGDAAVNSSGTTDYHSYCFVKSPSSGVGANVTVKNNILINNFKTISETTTWSQNYAIGNLSTTPNTGWTSDYNFLSTQMASGFPVGKWNATDATNLTNWRSTSGNDANSYIGSGNGITAIATNSDPPTPTNNTTNGTVNPYDLFTSAKDGDLHIVTTGSASYLPYQYMGNNGTTLASVTTDYDNSTRLSPPDLGADQFNLCSGTNPTSITVNANGASGTVLAAINSAVTLTVPTITGGSNCGAWKYAWSNNGGASGSWWNGSAFSGTSATYLTAYSSIAPTITTNTTYTAYVQATGNQSQGTSNTVIVNVVTPPAITATADGNTNETVANNVPVNLVVTPSGGSGCTGSWQYAWRDGTNYWNGTAFASATAVFDASYNSINPTVTATKTYTAYVNCSTCTNATATSNTSTVTIGTCAAPTLTAKANNGTGTVTAAPNDNVNLTVTTSGGNYCNGNGAWIYAWSNNGGASGSWWNGTDFTGTSASYNTSYGSINITATGSGTTTYNTYAQCENNSGCSSTTNAVSVNVVLTCSAPVLTAKADGNTTSETIPNNSTVALTANPGGAGANCGGTFVYAWRNGTGGNDYWNGTNFTGDNTNYSASYSSITLNNVTTGRTFQALVKCSADASCNNTSSVTVNIGSCSAPSLTAKANGSTGTITIPSSDGVTLTANSSGGTYCDAGSPWEYAWSYDATHWWNGTDFSSSTAVYSQGNTTISPTNLTTNQTYTVYVRCFSNASCNNNSSVTVNVSVCTAPTITAKANSTAGTVTVAYNTSTTLTANPSGGTYCPGGGVFEYAWFDGTNYWNGSSFTSATAIYNSSYTSLSAFNATVSKVYTSYVRCQGNTACNNTSSVTLLIGATLINETWESGTGSWTLGGSHTTNVSNWGSCSTAGQAHGGTKYASVKYNASGCDDYAWDVAANIDLTYTAGVNLTGYTTASLTFWYKSLGDVDGGDYGQVFLDGTTNLGGGNQSGGTKYWGNSTWTQVTIDLTPYCGSSHTFKFKWINDAVFSGNPDPPFALDDIVLSASTPLGTSVTNPVLYSTGGNSQLCFNNSHINTTTPTFRVSATSNGTFDTYQVEINTNSTFSGGTAYTQTFGSGSYTNGTQYNLTFTNGFTPSNNTVYYARVRASGNGGTTWSSWTSTQHSFVYDNSVTTTEWYQGFQQQFIDNGYAASNLSAYSNNIAFTPFTGGSNPFTDPGLNSGSGWSKTYSPYVSGGTPIYNTFITTDDNGTGGKTESTGCARFSEDDNSWQSFVNGEFGGIYQQVNLTGVTSLTWDATVWRNTQSNVYQCGIGRSCKIVYGFEVVIGDNAGVSDASGTVVYLRQPTTSELPEFATKQYLNETVDISSYGFTGTKYVKFIRVVTSGGGVWYDDEKWYLDNIRTSSTAPTSGTFTSAPAYLASINGALNWSTLKWNQTLNGGTITFKIQKFSSGSWSDVSGLTNLSASGDGDKSVSIASSSDAQIRIMMTMTQSGTSPVLNNWALTATSCTAPTLTAKANGVATSTTVAAGTSTTLTANGTGGSNCSDYFEYAWFDGSNYWNGSSFASGTAVYDASYSSITFSAAATKTFTVTARCHAATNCVNTSQVILNVATVPASITAAIGSPANGTQHHLTVSWSSAAGVDGYGLEYSTNGSSWSTIGDITPGSTVTYDFNAGDNPNAPYYFRVRSKLNSVYSGYASMVTPTYTACDDPALPTLGTPTNTTIPVSITTETPVANPAITTYSIYNATTGQYVQANGSLGATEVFQTKSQWGTISVTGLTQNTNYCFYTRAKNNDGDIRYQAAATLLAAEPFSSDVINNSSTPPTSGWGSPGTCGAGAWFDYNATAGCSGGGGAKWTGTSDNFTLGCYLRTPLVNATGYSQVTLSFDMTNHQDAGDNINFSCWSVGDNAYNGSLLTVNGVSASQITFSSARNCTHIDAVFSLSGITNKSQLMFYINNNGDNDFGSYNLVIDNWGVFSPTPTACATTTNITCTGPSITSATAAASPICASATTNLTANGVGGTNALVTWWTGTGGTGVNLGTGTSLNGIVGPGTYYARVTADCGSPAEASVTVASKINVSITSATADASPICSNATTTVRANGVAGTNSTVSWYTGSNGTGSNLGTGTTLTAGPGTYYARVTGDCGTPAEASVTVSAKTNVAIGGITAGTNPVCTGGTTSLTATGVAGTNATVTWYTGAGGTGSNLGTSNPLTNVGVGTYYARVTGDCGSPAETSITITQQVCGFNLTVNVFLQGYYIGGGKMSPLLYILNSGGATAVDTITVELHRASSPYDSLYAYRGVLNSSGSITCAFPAGANGGNYYIVVKHRNSIDTWSASAQNVSSIGSYSFTTSGQAYGSMANLGGGIYGIYSGDVNGDGTVNHADKFLVQHSIHQFPIGTYSVYDVNGDAMVDAADLRIVRNNIPLNLTVGHP